MRSGLLADCADEDLPLPPSSLKRLFSTSKSGPVVRPINRCMRGLSARLQAGRSSDNCHEGKAPPFRTPRGTRKESSNQHAGAWLPVPPDVPSGLLVNVMSTSWCWVSPVWGIFVPRRPNFWASAIQPPGRANLLPPSRRSLQQRHTLSARKTLPLERDTPHQFSDRPQPATRRLRGVACQLPQHVRIR